MTVAQEQQAKTEVLESHQALFRAMVEGRTDVLDDLLEDRFTLTHITGYVQPRDEWLAEIRSAKFRYHEIDEKNVSVELAGSTAVLISRAVFTVTIGGSRGTWSLQSTLQYRRTKGHWTVDWYRARFD
ncbi:DUF4440 domain-containing protein [Deinococcus ruber]|uniref:DUF4440 domain-containing protein n=2 Tax=Deinococcus ruber TaxID=1848197 RepID=A0A918FHC8_9DEIO|nr:DUF4440 domain-containing protein [Deinococcus ruber]